MKCILSFLFLTVHLALSAQSDNPIAKVVNPSSVHPTWGGYSHATVIDLGNYKMVITAGQIALDQQGNLVGKGNFKKQAEQVYLNLKNILAEEGGTMDHIVRTGTYVLDMANIQSFREVRSKFLNSQTPPASTLVQVEKLFVDGALIEIEVTAIIPKKSK